ncbi:TIGR02444 family protein [Catenovulum sp. SM1970]|uniref:TIGR02444 family protein n=1 Tax=Marinifaba aquimaris TaxID=2741323 RepID=UPI0015732CDB|nr:TIGR02444 family protein [Marinifaba aquimaris]NTS75687.1 TIGR02444 family protein [Marinifaba aquimaris]
MTNESFWQYSLTLYQQTQMQSLCLQLQNEYQVNVNLLLFCCYLQSLDKALSALQLKDIETALLPFNKAYTTKLRQLRQNLKTDETLVATTQQTLKQALLKCELTMEQHEQAIIVQSYQATERQDTSTMTPVACYFQQLNIQVTCDTHYQQIQQLLAIDK